MTRRWLLAGGAAVLAGAAVAPSADAIFPARHRVLRGETVALGDGGRVIVPEGAANTVVPDSRVLRDQEGTDRLLAEEAAFVAGSAPWTSAVDPRWQELLRSAVLDVGVLTRGLPVAVAGWSANWRYAWPRDGAHIAAALVALGRTEEALDQLLFFQAVQDAEPGAWFHARYRLDGSPVLDGRARQLDGTGWLLWAADRLVAADAATAPLIAPLVTRCTALLTDQVVDGMPPVSPDYWEVPETRVTLGTAATVLAGLVAATGPRLSEVLTAGQRTEAERVRDRARARVQTEFADQGYPRHVGRSLPDAAITFLAPPYQRAASDQLRNALPIIRGRLTRPAGGVSPGLGWPRDGISWTPQTALFASAHAHLGQREEAGVLLDWLAHHRTEAGSLPEKVLADHSPAEVAPLTWTASVVVLALHALTDPPE